MATLFVVCHLKGTGQDCLEHNIPQSVIHAADFASTYGGNFIASLRMLHDVCSDAGLRLVLVVPPSAKCRGWAQDWMNEGRSVHFVSPTPAASTLTCTRELAKIAAKEDALIIHTHFTQYDVPAWLASGWLGLRRLHPKVVWHKHSDFPVRHTFARSVKDRVKFRWMGRSAHIIGVSEKVIQDALAAGFPSASMCIIPNGVDTRRATTPTSARAEMLVPLHLQAGESVVLLFGWSPEVKGVDLAMDAVRQLAREGEKVVLAAVGTQEMVDFIQKRLETNEAPSWLRILAPSESVANLYQIADIFLSASRNEGFSYSVGEAMSWGMPVVLSDIPGVGWAKQAPGAVFFPAGDSKSLADSLRTVLHWSSQQRAVSAGARDFVAERFDVARWANRVMAFYRKLLDIERTLA